MEFTRRRLLAATASAAGVGALSGCTGGSTDGSAGGAESETDRTTARASFFVFGDVASAVAGDAAEAELLVPVGQHGHGWEPGPSVREDIHGADLLVHGMEGFQPWVDDVRGDLEADGSSVTTVDVSAGLDPLSVGEDHDHGEDGHHDEEGGHDDGEDHHHDEEDDHDGDHHHEEGDDQDHGRDEYGTDPHFWMDPVRLGGAVGTVRDAFADVDDDNAEAYAENADAYRRELDALHERIESTVADAPRDVLLVAGHDSFRYFGDRYDVEVEALTEMSPDDRPTPRDVERAQEAIERHDLRYICADPLESQQAAEQLVAETDAEAVLPLTAMPGLTSEWEENDWGYVEIMERVNVPSLERALGATDAEETE